MRWKSMVGVMVLSAAISVTGFATAGATPGVDREFAAQGKAAGLTATQVTTLQAEANGYLAELGGRQVALNRIELDGATIEIALPGEARPRQLAPGVLHAACEGGGADPKYFCAYRKEHFTGTHIAMYTCKVYDIPERWVGPGSWHNNQTRGRVATMYNDAGKAIAWSTAPDWDASGNWTPVDRMRNC